MGMMQDVETGHVLQHFQRDGPLAGDDVRIVVGMHPDEIAFGRDRLGARLRLRERLAVEHDCGAERLGRLHLHERRRHRHDDGRRYRQPARVIGHRLGMVAGRHGDHAAAALVGAERRKLYAGATLLERVGDLQILVFDKNLGPGERRQRRRREQRRAQHMTGDRAPGSLDVGERHHRRIPSLSLPYPFLIPSLSLSCRFACFGAALAPLASAAVPRHLPGRYHAGLIMTDSGPLRIGISLDVKPHAYDPTANPELFEGVLARRIVAFGIDIIIIAIPLVAASVLP